MITVVVSLCRTNALVVLIVKLSSIFDFGRCCEFLKTIKDPLPSKLGIALPRMFVMD